jgi:hypothetical protein
MGSFSIFLVDTQLRAASVQQRPGQAAEPCAGHRGQLDIAEAKPVAAAPVPVSRHQRQKRQGDGQRPRGGPYCGVAIRFVADDACAE